MNTNSIDERVMLRDISRGADALVRIAKVLEAELERENKREAEHDAAMKGD